MTGMIWLAHDGKAGNLSQLDGLGQALGEACRHVRATAEAPWSKLPPGLWRGAVAGRLLAGEPLAPPWPAIVIGAGRRTARAVLWIKAAGGGAPFAIQIQDSGVAPARFDLVTVPRHDRLRGPNVVVTEGAIHRVTAAALAAARAAWAPRLADLPAPRIAVLVGGSNRAYRMTEAAAAGIADGALALAAATAGGLMVTVSRRTGPAAEAVLRARLAGPAVRFWDGTGENPYLGYLALADRIVVTADSVSMLSEAAATGRPVHVAEMAGGTAKFDRFHECFRSLGITRPLTAPPENWSYDPPDDAARVAAAVRARLAGRP